MFLGKRCLGDALCLAELRVCWVVMVYIFACILCRGTKAGLYFPAVTWKSSGDCGGEVARHRREVEAAAQSLGASGGPRRPLLRGAAFEVLRLGRPRQWALIAFLQWGLLLEASVS